ncbi:MAG TPA: efflux RND transporter periplasmic adaptor subunit [Tepidisphaeraceae bacterium]|jgi:RND family efflux transporter MFP subunit
MNTHSETTTSPKNGNGNTHMEHGSSHRQQIDSPPPSSGMGWKLAIVVVVLAAGLGIGFAVVRHHRADQESLLQSETQQTTEEAPTVDTVLVKSAPSSNPLSLPGETHGWYQSTIYARVNGYVDKWNVDIGDKVHKGEILATIATPDLDAQSQAAIQQLAVAQSGIAVAQANAAFAKTTYERWHNSPPGVVAPQETDEKKAAYDSSIAELQAAQSKVSAAEAEVDRLRAMESYKNVTVPYDGIITMRRIDIGNLVTAGSTSNTSPLYDLAQVNVIRVFADVPQYACSQITIGVPATMTSKSFPGRVFHGTVARTARAIDTATREMKVEVDIPNPDGTLVPGMYVTVNFQVQRKGLLEIPASALMFRTAGPQVAVVNANGKIDFHEVEIAVDDGNNVDIGSGLQNGDRIALNLSSQISDGEKVQVASAAGQP